MPNAQHRIELFARGALLAWVFFLPLQTRWILKQGVLAGGMWEYGTVSLYATDILLLISFLGFLFVLGKDFWRAPKHFSRLVLVSLLGIFLVSAASFIASVDVGLSANMIIRLVLGMLAWWLLLKSRLQLRTLATTIVASASLEAVFCVVQLLTQSVPASTLFGLAAHNAVTAGDSVVETAGGRFLRAYGTLPHPNMASGFFSLGALLCAGLYLRSENILDRLSLLVSFIVIQAGLFATFARMAMFSWIVLLLILAVAVLIREYTETKPWWKSFGFARHERYVGLKALKLVIASTLLFGMMLIAFAPLVNARVSEQGRLEHQSVAERVSQIQQAQTLLHNHLFLGVGIGAYTKALYDTSEKSGNVWEYQPVHLTLLLILVELGVLGWLIVVWAIFSVVAVTMQKHAEAWKQNQRHGIPWIAIMSMALLLIFLQSFTDHYFWSLQFGVMLTWLTIGLWSASTLSDEQ